MTDNQSKSLFSQVLSFVRMPLVLITLYAIGRFILGLAGVPYAPRGNAVFSVLGLTVISCLYFGAMSKRVGGLGWGGTILAAVVMGLYGQILIFLATFISYSMNLTTYYLHWDALNIAEGANLPMMQALVVRAGGFIGGPITAVVAISIGRALGFLAPVPKSNA